MSGAVLFDLDDTLLVVEPDVVAVRTSGHRQARAAIFEFAFGHLDVPASAAVMVGDNLDRDMKGAHRLGMSAVWRPSRGRPTEWKPAVASLGDLPAPLGIA